MNTDWTRSYNWGGGVYKAPFYLIRTDKIRIWVLEKIKVLYQCKFMKLITVLWLCKNIPILKKYTLFKEFRDKGP